MYHLIRITETNPELSLICKDASSTETRFGNARKYTVDGVPLSLHRVAYLVGDNLGEESRIIIIGSAEMAYEERKALIAWLVSQYPDFGVVAKGVDTRNALWMWVDMVEEDL